MGAAVCAPGRRIAGSPDFHRVVPDEDGVWRMPDARAWRGGIRSNIGTIVSDASMQVPVRQWRKAGLGGRELHRTPQTRRCVFMFAKPPAGAGAHAADDGLCAHRPQRAAPRRRAGAARAHAAVAYAGRCHAAPAGAGRARRVRIARNALRAAAAGAAGRRGRPCPHPAAWWPRCCTRARAGTCTCTRWRGRLVHLGLAGLLAWRASQQVPNTFSIAVNDYGLELLSAKPVDWPAAAAPDWRATHSAVGEGLEAEVLASLNATEMAPGRFRELRALPGSSSKPPGRAAQQRTVAGIVVPLLRRVRAVRPGQPAAGPGPGRAAGAGTGHGPPGPDHCNA